MSQRPLTIALVGNPNCGKTSLFNRLTGARQAVGNWPGVTVERKSGWMQLGSQRVEVIDLPGVYSLSVAEEGSLDEAVARRFIQAGEADWVINVVDACNLERNLYLTTQLLEMGVPLLLAVNMLDLAKQRGLSLDLNVLSEQLGCPVVGVIASQKRGVEALLDTLSHTQPRVSAVRPPYPASLVAALPALSAEFCTVLAGLPSAWASLACLERDGDVLPRLSTAQQQWLDSQRTHLEHTLGEEIDIVLADARYQLAHATRVAVVHEHARLGEALTRRIDALVLHRWLGLPIFLLVMYALFLWTIHVGGAFVDFFDGLGQALVVGGIDNALQAVHSPDWLRLALAEGVGGGIRTVATFIPIVGCLFLFLAALEDSGYMARAAFVMDRLMRTIGLPGKAFVPMIVGFGCNVPAIMAGRTLENARDRQLSALMVPFMSCGARLPVYVLFVAVFFPENGHNVVFALYLIGILVAVGSGLLLTRTLLPGSVAPLVLELPPYHRPLLGNVLLHTWERLKGFVIRAGQLIVPMVVVLNLLNGVDSSGRVLTPQDDHQQSLLADVGRTITPLFAPLGVQPDNWPASVGLFTGVLAKEAVAGTLASLYGQQDDSQPLSTAEAVSEAFASVPRNLATLWDKLSDPLGLQESMSAISSDSAPPQMAHYFAGASGAFAYLLFVLLYTPCVATLSAIQRELGGRWMVFSAAWTTSLAYCIAVLAYQAGQLSSAPFRAGAWMVGSVVLVGVVLWLLRHNLPTQQRLVSS